MKIIFAYIIMIVCCFCIINCEGDSKDYNDFIVIDSISTSYDYFRDINKTIEGQFYSKFDTLNIDINSDNVNDILFSSQAIGSAGGIRVSSSEVETLQGETFIAIIEKIDTLCRYKVYYDSIECSYFENYDNNKSYDSSLQMIFDTNIYPNMYLATDTIRKNVDWRNGKFIFIYFDFTTSIAGCSSDKIIKGFWYDVSNKFLAVRFIRNGEEYLGWIELNLHGNAIHIHRYAFNRIKVNSN